MKAFFGAVIVAVCLAQATALECYSCTDCEFSGAFAFLESKTTCTNTDLDIFGVFDPRCLKTVSADGTVIRSCGTAATCTATNLFIRCTSADDTNCMICCDTDACNSALNVKAAWMSVVLALSAAILAARF